MNRYLRLLFFILIVKPLAAIVLGTNVRRANLLPGDGPAILVANHNSHLDTLVLMALFPARMVDRLRPVAAADYFLRNRLLAWFALRIMGIIPLDRSGRARRGEHPLTPCMHALDRGEVLILFPEGTRGEPEKPAAMKSGVAHLVEHRPDVPVVPIYMHGLGKALPRGEALLVPCICDVFVGDPVPWDGARKGFMALLQSRFDALAAEMAEVHRGWGDDDP